MPNSRRCWGSAVLRSCRPLRENGRALRKRGTSKDSGAFRQISEVAPFSATAEALRYIKVAIDLHPAGGKVVGIVSALPGEGKTTVAAGFAAFVAKSGGRTLLIDADLRNPSIDEDAWLSE